MTKTLMALEVRDAPDGPTRTIYVERAALAALVIAGLKAARPDIIDPPCLSHEEAAALPTRHAKLVEVEVQHLPALATGEAGDGDVVVTRSALAKEGRHHRKVLPSRIVADGAA